MSRVQELEEQVRELRGHVNALRAHLGWHGNWPEVTMVLREISETGKFMDKEVTAEKRAEWAKWLVAYRWHRLHDNIP